METDVAVPFRRKHEFKKRYLVIFFSVLLFCFFLCCIKSWSCLGPKLQMSWSFSMSIQSSLDNVLVSGSAVLTTTLGPRLCFLSLFCVSSQSAKAPEMDKVYFHCYCSIFLKKKHSPGKHPFVMSLCALGLVSVSFFGGSSSKQPQSLTKCWLYSLSIAGSCKHRAK